MSAKYLIDANVFIEASNRYYGFRRVPAFWDWCLNNHESDMLFSVHKVREELTKRQDDLAAWAKALPKEFFIAPDDKTIALAIELSEWANSHPQYFGYAKVEFLSSADLFLIAHAGAHDFTVVSHETPSPESKKSIKIPDACDAHDVKWIQVWDWLDNMNPRFS